MPLDKFKQAGRPAFPDFSVSTGKRTYAFKQTGTIGNDPVIQIALANESTLVIRMIVTQLTHPHDWTYGVSITGSPGGYSFGTCDQLIGALPRILGQLEKNPATMPLDGPGLSTHEN